MSNRESAQVADPHEKVVPITDPDSDSPAPGVVSKRPFVLENKRGAGGGNLAMMLIVVGVIVVLGICMLTFLSNKGTEKKRTPKEAAKPNLGHPQTANTPGDLIPSDKVKPSPDETKQGGTVDASDIERTKSPKLGQSQIHNGTTAASTGKALSEVGKFEDPDTTSGASGKWSPPPYGSNQAAEQQVEKKEEEAYNKPSIVFTAHQQVKGRSESTVAAGKIDNLGLSPGYHVAARLESMATTAVHAPVTAIVEYNYERNGQILIPAGSCVVGKIAQADPSGLVNITFSSMEFPSGETVPIDAVAADMNLQALKGQVTGKQRGKSMVVRSLSGIGETAAMMVGAPRANSAFSEDDLIRMRIADNIGNASDEQIMQMMTMQHIVVSVPAGTEIYVIFARPAINNNATSAKTIQVPGPGNVTDGDASNSEQ